MNKKSVYTVKFMVGRKADERYTDKKTLVSSDAEMAIAAVRKRFKNDKITITGAEHVIDLDDDM